MFDTCHYEKEMASNQQPATATRILSAGLLLYFSLVVDWKLSKESDSNRWATVSRQNSSSHNVQLCCEGKAAAPNHFRTSLSLLFRQLFPGPTLPLFSPNTLQKAHLLSDSSYICVCCCWWRRSGYQPLEKKGKNDGGSKAMGKWQAAETLVWFLFEFFFVFFFFFIQIQQLVTVGPDFDESTVAGGIDLISQTAASWEGVGGGLKKGECVFYRATLCSAACNYPLPHWNLQTLSKPLSETLK